MDPPEGYLAAKPGQVCRLRRSLYGLKQASRQWNLELTTKLLDYGFTQSAHDNCLFLKHTGFDFIALLIYVDDILLTGTSESSLYDVKQYLDGLFTIKDLGSAKYFLGLELARSSHSLLVTQHKYIQDILSDTSMLNAKVASTPFPSGLHLTHDEGALLQFPDRYRRLVGRLLYLGFTRPDPSFPIQQLNQYMQHPRTSHWDVALHVLRYLKGSCNLGLFFPSQNFLSLTAYSDAALASCLDSRCSITRFCVFLGGSLISWKTKKQATRPIPVWCDNKVVLHITANPVFHERTKHLDIDCHLVHDQFKCGFIAPSFIRGPDQPTDFFTKALPVSVFARLLAVENSSSSSSPLLEVHTLLEAC
ncbi:UNVERIFIED_CONTAM: Retrovirus-related Pol polyprotein from transposon RE1 [Sesamum calycinum]|uniref:Retrovirus-related Pol polyprotein from transposon RE1 n=1 Tax=Sesamum calycinum TaxID=2727403 RepID=A0AAW2JDC8_9LAMI